MIKSNPFLNFDCTRVPSPCYVVDEVAVEANLKVLARVKNESGAKILLALKAFSMFSLAPLINQYLSGVCASGLYEARLGAEEFEGEVHTYSAAFKEPELSEVLTLSDHVVFNSFNQWQRFQPLLQKSRVKRAGIQFGLRVNPMHSEGATALYDPCAPGSRLGIPFSAFKGQSLTGISGLHFHTLCEQGFEPLARTLDVIEQQFANILPRLEWVNFGGGHHITEQGYDVDALILRIKAFQKKYNLQVYLEPGEAIAIHSGVLVSEVLDITQNDGDIAILDTSATCHMPDTIEMPYRAEVLNSAGKGEKNYDFRLGGQTCLAGDVMGDYSFDLPLRVGQRLMFDDMSHYTMVKTTTFNGIGLPAIALWNSNSNALKIVREFGYRDFKDRLS
ncbi:carboxynorspermidine decarboxylase [Psychromonas sp. psych-6C06]|uniref:carboxynorspermidine decarboxylase n=1 Tax=Psychromonas sp. psych-6C06 TaxID=2058089 RepID=UPI000C334BEF|nr:carboxynorspermidine decarboxylase [Psychromonas sp. psych-6C06]PKF61564.1 carboxynorspermidine decarboxylase [Psychromonas sp. psych-6C06]